MLDLHFFLQIYVKNKHNVIHFMKLIFHYNFKHLVIKTLISIVLLDKKK